MISRRTTAVLAATGLLALAACGSSKKAAVATTAAPAATTAAPAVTTAAPAATTAAPAATTAAPAATTAKPAATTAAPAAAGSYKTDPVWGGLAEATSGGKCGLGNGQKATGAAVKIGAVTTMIPGIDFKDGPNAQMAFFKCVNDNGGVHGRPIELINVNDELDPAKAGAAAAKLIDSDKVVAIAGGFSIIDCPVNGKTYAAKGYNIIVAGVPAECFGQPNIAATNMGPHYSAQGAAQAVIRDGAKGKIVHVTGNNPGADYNGTSVKTLAEAAGMQFEDVQVALPIKDGNTLVADLVKKAGKGGGIVITFTPPEALTIMKAAEDQNLIDEVVWGSATPANDASVAKALSSKWDGKMRINAELAPLDTNGPDMKLIKEVLAKYDTKTPLGSFAQMGFLIGQLVVDTLNKMPAADIDSAPKVNAAIKAIKNYKTDILCRPWYYGDGASHVPNNWDLTVVPKGGVMVVKDKCFEITAVDDILKGVRTFEAANNVNKG